MIGDLNGDGRDDLIKLTGGNHHPTPNWTGYGGTRDPIRVCYSNGAGFDAPINLPLPDQAYRLFDDKDVITTPGTILRGGTETVFRTDRWFMTQVGDFNGDGIADIVDFLAGTGGGFQQGYREPTTTLLDPDRIRGGVDLVKR